MSAPDLAVRFETRSHGEVAFVTLGDPARLNALGSDLMARFIAEVERLGARPDLRAIVLQGAGAKAFVGGADIGEMAALSTPQEARTFITRVHKTCAAVRDCPVPVIAAIRGWCLGAGLELAAACDLRLATVGSRLGMPEVRLGVPSVVEAALLPALMGAGPAREMLMLGETIDATTALRLGLLNAAAEAAEFEALLEAKLDAILAGGPVALRLQKALMRRWEGEAVEAAISAGIEAFAAAYESGEAQRRMGAFMAEREARRAARGPA
ncbi:MAG: enoyl-CoA hydratase/isomerase family protein [Alphaproteobacteria bacterium]|nr:enoyl-CoA hydratase/isomerase family protein [Alphaproteobacteria bacterium]